MLWVKFYFQADQYIVGVIRIFPILIKLGVFSAAEISLSFLSHSLLPQPSVQLRSFPLLSPSVLLPAQLKEGKISCWVVQTSCQSQESCLRKEGQVKVPTSLFLIVDDVYFYCIFCVLKVRVLQCKRAKMGHGKEIYIKHIICSVFPPRLYFI